MRSLPDPFRGLRCARRTTGTWKPLRLAEGKPVITEKDPSEQTKRKALCTSGPVGAQFVIRRSSGSAKVVLPTLLAAPGMASAKTVGMMRTQHRSIAARMLLSGLLASGPRGGTLTDNLMRILLGPVEATPSAPPLGQEELDCLSCHDGVTARAPFPRAVVPGKPYRSRGSHPVGMRYDIAASRQPDRYRPRAALNPRIQLIDGKVSCVSCHEVRGPSRAALAALGSDGPAAHPAGRDRRACTTSGRLTVRSGTDLCLSCHDL